jgi:hypothetical protein
MEHVGDNYGISQALSNLGIVYLTSERKEDVKPIFNRAYEILKNISKPDAEFIENIIKQAFNKKHNNKGLDKTL